MNIIYARVAAIALALAGSVAVAQSPAAGDQILERLGPRIESNTAQSGDLASRVSAIRQAIHLARQTADERYLGQAQGLTGADWNNPQAPAVLTLLKATIQQHRHEFSDALSTLRMLTARPTQALSSSGQDSAERNQAWLTIAVIERVLGQYDAALAACANMVGAPLIAYREACRLETESLRGNTKTATKGFHDLLASNLTPAQNAWIRSLFAEHLERVGNDAEAAKHYGASLIRDPDHYTAIAYSDLLIRTKRPQGVLQALAGLPDSDSTLVRKAIALKQLKQSKVKEVMQTIEARFEQQTQRDPMRRTHLREQALYMLMVKDDPLRALALAEENLKIQREPMDWLIAVQSARAANQPKRLQQFITLIRKQGLIDARLGV